ncbi:MAG TPA: sulfatase-like hydrolase/transferase [Opitutaceae bacterium]|nr:sulfatase-like hydrolase/transferase [Opitutaceae bacterium]
MNVLWIVTTQWRAQACGYAGDPNARTPVLDALAAESVNFTQAVTPHPFGPFARAALLTGIPSPENGVADYYDALPDDSHTIAHDFRERGYTTAFFGKWHLAKRDPRAPLVGEEHARMVIPDTARGGFGFFEGFEGGFQLNNPWLHGSRLPVPTQFEGYQSDVLCRRTADWVAAQARHEPWFCVLSLEPPHPPYAAHPVMPGPSAAELSLRGNVPAENSVLERARAELAGYYGHIAATDRAIGELLACIDISTTAIVFTSVHGDMHGSHGCFRKGWPYEESVRVPLLIRVPQGDAEQRDDPVSLLDLRRATLRLTEGAAAAEAFARANDSRAWAKISMPSVVQLPLQCDRVWRGLRSKQRKFVRGADGAPWLFFDLERDPLERTNLVNDPAYADEIAEWSARFLPTNHTRDTNSFPDFPRNTRKTRNKNHW